MTKVLYISYDGMTDPLGQSQVIPYLSGLSKLGYEIHLISFEKPEKKDKISYIYDLLNKQSIVWHPLNYTKNPPILSTIKDVWSMRKLAVLLHLKHNFSIVHCRSYLSAIVGEYLKKKFGIKFIFDMRGFWADERVEGGLWNIKNPIYWSVYKFFKKKEIHFLKYADYTISLTEKAKSIILGWDKSSSFAPIKVIPCCVDLSLFRYDNNMKGTFLRQSYDLVLGYLGTIGTWYMLDEMLAFYAQLLKYFAGAHFLFVTTEDKTLIENSAIRYGISKDKLTVVKANRDEVPYYISCFDISVFFIRPTFSKTASSPTKQGELMAMGIPIICNSGLGDTDYVIKKYRCGYLVEDFQDFKPAIDAIPGLLKLKKEDIRKAAADFYALEKGISRYAEVYAELIA